MISEGSLRKLFPAKALCRDVSASVGHWISGRALGGGRLDVHRTSDTFEQPLVERVQPRLAHNPLLISSAFHCRRSKPLRASVRNRQY